MPFAPTRQQSAFIDDPNLELVLVACPGSGKTHTSVLRFIDRCKVKTNYGIALLSFTNTAVDEASRVAREGGGAGLIGYPNVIETIDAFFQHYVFEPFISVTVPDAKLPLQIIEEDRTYPSLSKDNGCKVRGLTPNLPGQSYGTPVDAWDVRASIDFDGNWIWQYDAGRPDRWTNIEGSRGQLKNIHVGKARCIELGYATFNDVLLYCFELLNSSKFRVADIVAHRFGEIIVDEAQDTSMLHQAMLKILASAGSKISYVGDPQQGIYRFNHANAKYLEYLAETSHVKHELTENYRSIKAVVDVVNSRFGRKMVHKRERRHDLYGAYVFVGAEEAATEAFESFLGKVGLHVKGATVVSRHWDDHGKALRASVMDGWRTAYKHALTAWQSERLHKVEQSLRSSVSLMRLAIDDDTLSAMDGTRLKELAWTFVRCGALPAPRDDETPFGWAERVKLEITKFLLESDLKKHSRFGQRFSVQKISDRGSAKKKLEVSRPPLRTTVVHRVKGESISGVLVIAPHEQHAAWLKEPTNEDELEESNICYVAFTRAADLLVVQCPTEDVAARWRKHGFKNLTV
ncbi:MAG: UvrD-helicase domain-containing protein [Vulcanimicrobiaceae bacterium]|jgi:superfamily I DNA/RNA helicase